MNAITPIQIPMLPANVEAEAALLGAMMRENSLIDRVADIVAPGHFFEAAHERIFTAIIKEASQGRIANPVTLKPYFDHDEAVKELGGAGYLAQLTGSGAVMVGALDFARQIEELARRRALIEGLQKAMDAAHDPDLSVDEALGEVEVAASAAGRNDGSDELSGADCIEQALQACQDHTPGVTCGVEPIDEALGPIRQKNLTILAARPGMGKTAVALSYGIGAARKGKGVLFVSLEMSREELGERMACDLAFNELEGGGLRYDDVTNGHLDRTSVGLMMEAQEEMMNLPFQVVDAAGMTIAKLAAVIRRWKRRFAAKGQSLDLVIVDYLQLLRAPGAGSRYAEITEISMALKTAAKANDVGIMALAQLSREVEKRDDKRPHLSDLRDSGQIEQDADAILFLLRREYYLKQVEPEGHTAEHLEWEQAMSAVRGKIDFICAKRRKGQPRTTTGHFYGAYQAVRS